MSPVNYLCLIVLDEKKNIQEKEAGYCPVTQKEVIILRVKVVSLMNPLLPSQITFFKMGHSRSFQYTVDSKQMFISNKFLPMTGFEPRTSGIGSDSSTN